MFLLMTFRWLHRTEHLEPVAHSPSLAAPAAPQIEEPPPLGNLLVFAANSTFWQQRIYAFIREHPHSSLLSVVQQLWPDFLALPSHRRGQAWFWTKEQLHQLVADGVLCCSHEDDRVALWSLNYAAAHRPGFAGCADPTPAPAAPDLDELAPLMTFAPQTDRAPAPVPELAAREIDALKDAYGDARSRLADAEAALAARTEELTHLREAFEKTRENLIRLQLTITELRDERHRLAEHAAEAEDLRRQIDQLTAERDRLRQQLDLHRTWKE
jgi:hypothetical protein